MENSKETTGTTPKFAPNGETATGADFPICALHPEDFGACPMIPLLRDNPRCPTCELNT